MRTLRLWTLTFALLAAWPLASTGTSADTTEKVDGYAEWRTGDIVVVDGQRVRVVPATRFKGRAVRRLEELTLGLRVEAKGRREPGGVIVAESLEAKANDLAFLEPQVLEATSAIESQWVRNGYVQLGEGDKPARLHERGPDVERVRRLMARLTPPYVPSNAVRTRVVDRPDWNAFAMGNGAVFVHTGLLREMSDDELAVILGHELAHYTHEHSRKGMKRAFMVQLIAAGVAVAAETAVDSDKAKAVIGLAGVFSVLALTNGYGRDLEDQADRVGLRYAYEGGFDVREGPRVWQRFRQKYGEENRVANFFFSKHSQAGARQRNLEREIALNYAEPVSPRAR